MPSIRLMLAALSLLFSVPFMTSGASAQTATLFSILNGANECNGALPPLCAQGDANGVGTATLMLLGPTSLCATIIVNNIVAPTAAHVHSGAQGVNGAVVLALTAPGAGSPGASLFCTGAAPAGLTNQLRANPQNFYINVHNAVFPGGAVRGQLF